MPTKKPTRRRSMLRLWFVALIASVTIAPASAQQPAEPVQQVARDFLERETAGLPGYVEISLSPLDPSNRLPVCTSLEAFFPAGMRAWGAVSVGVRCNSPVAWSVYLSGRVAVMNEYLVTARPIRPGQIVGPEDLRTEYGDLATQPSSVLTELSQAIGHHARYAVAAGNTVRADMLRLPPAVQQGQSVKILGSGPGFTVTNEGRALNRAADGEPVRVRLPNGQVVTGTARSGGIVEIRF
ncbi:flagellar basal body P-ring formation chaperone FlgA [Rhodocyclaceae bacterium SMB388]